MEINKKNLPVLYTIPEWNLRIKIGNEYSYLIPEIGKYTSYRSVIKILRKLEIDIQSWYDRWFLGITSKFDRPRCKICGKEAAWKGLLNAYGRRSCYSKICETELKRLNKSLSMINRYSDPLEREKDSLAQKKRYENPEERLKTSIAMKKANELDPTIRERIGNSNRKFWRNASDEYKKTHGEKISESSKTEESRKKRSLSQKISYENNPDRRIKTGESLRDYYKNNPEKSLEIGMKISKYYEDNPEARIEQSERSRNSWSNPSEIRLENGCGPRGISNLIYSEWESKTIKLDSSWELTFFNKCKSLNAIKLIRCPFSIRYNSDIKGLNRVYLPDFLLNDHYLIEIKPNYLLDDEVNIAKFNAADVYCRENELEYVILTEDYLFNNGEPFYGSMPF